MLIARWSPSNRKSCRCHPPQLTPIKIPIQMVMKPPLKIISLKNKSDLRRLFKCKTLKSYLRNERPVNSGNTHYISNMYIGRDGPRRSMFMLCCKKAKRPIYSELIVFKYSDDFIVVRCICNYILAIRECIKDYFKESISTRNRC